MIFIAMILGVCLGIVCGVFAPIIPYTYSSYLAIGIIAALDSVFGAIVAVLKNHFDIKVFVSGFFGNAVLAILLVYLRRKTECRYIYSSDSSICGQNV